MNISLKDWKELERIVANLKQSLAQADNRIFSILRDYHSNELLPEEQLILKLAGQVHNLRDQASLLMDCHPQSEWLGGDSDNPDNHTLREPNCCPMPRRHFTKEEIAEAKLVCEGPCHWMEVD